jgi:aspartyl-tRNA(Asn)/glutamyl-tRNA(Gln) amidotransferase subunit A
VLLGKLNCDEFAMGSSNENSAYGPVRNPVDTERVPGGSSGGSAAAVASNLAVATLGSDTGGSIRQPASFCGVVGVLPTYGRVSRYGLIAFASSLDRVGPFAANVRDAATLLGVIAGHDPKDATSSPLPFRGLRRRKRQARRRRVCASASRRILRRGPRPEVRAAIEKGIAALEAAGCIIKPVSLPHTKYAVPTYYLVATAEASANLARFDGVRYGYRSPRSDTLSAMYSHSRDEGFGAEVKRRILLGTYALSAGYYDAYYLKAQQVRRILAEEFLRAFAEVDAIVTPTSPTPGLQTRREDRRSAGHVPGRHLHRHRQPGRHLRRDRALRRNESGAAGRHAGPGPPFRRKHGLPRGARRRSRVVPASAQLVEDSSDEPETPAPAPAPPPK